MKSVTMISWEFAPFYVRGGTAYAIRRLADQLTALGIETRVLLPDWPNVDLGPDLPALLKPIRMPMRTALRDAPPVLQYSEFCRAAVEAVEQTESSFGSDAVIAHSDHGAMFIVLRRQRRSSAPSVFWLHSLYDPPISDFSSQQRRLLPSESLLASTVMMADIVVTSRGILKDARDFEWPDRLKKLQQALTIAAAEQRVLTVESVGCLPAAHNSNGKDSAGSEVENLKDLPLPFVLFPSRPAMAKGFGISAAIAERLHADKIACVAVRPPAHQASPHTPSRNGHVQWLPWLTQNELTVAMRAATCTVLPSITEGFGLTAAESISLGVPTLYHQVGGHHGLPAIPNALPISLTTTERARLYRLWSDLSVDHSDSWSIWTKYEASLKPLADKCVEAIRSVISSSPTGRNENAPDGEPAMDDEQWATKLCRRLEMNGALNLECADLPAL